MRAEAQNEAQKRALTQDTAAVSAQVNVNLKSKCVDIQNLGLQFVTRRTAAVQCVLLIDLVATDR